MSGTCPAVYQGAGGYASGSKLDEDAVDYVTILPYRLVSQSSEKRGLLLGEGLSVIRLVVVVITLHHSDSAAKTTANSFNGVRTHEYRDISADCSF